MLGFARLFVEKFAHFRLFSAGRYRQIREWTTSEVATWLKRTQAVNTRSPDSPGVSKEDIDGLALISLSREDLKEYLAVSTIKAARIETSIRDVLIDEAKVEAKREAESRKVEAKREAEREKLKATKVVKFFDQDGKARRIQIHSMDTFAEMLRNFMACALVDPANDVDLVTDIDMIQSDVTYRLVSSVPNPLQRLESYNQNTAKAFENKVRSYF